MKEFINWMKPIMKPIIKPILRSIWLGIKFSKYYILLIVILMAGYMASNYYLNRQPVYQTDNIPEIEEEMVTNNLTGVKLHCYLDTSPSMMGFFGVSGNSMEKFANALENLCNDNNLLDNGACYFCRDGIDGGNEVEDFFDCMRSVDISNSYYNRKFPLASFNNKGWKNVKTTGLSKIFTERYSNGDKYTDDQDIINMIITDMNFLTNKKSVKKQKRKIKNFAKELADAALDSNICIYNIRSDFLGKQNTDRYKLMWEESKEIDNNHSFFVIVMGKDNVNYHSFIEKIEAEFQKTKVEFAEQRFELKNNLFEGKHEITVDRAGFQESADEILNCLNLDNKSVKKIKENEIGVRIVDQNGMSGLKNMPVEEVQIPGIYLNQSTNNNSEIDTIIDVSYRLNPAQYQEYRGNDFIANAEAHIKWRDGRSWLYLDMDFNRNSNLPKKNYARNCAVVDIRFQMIKPGYTLPEWVSSINTRKITNDWSKKIFIKQLFKKIANIKQESYQELVSEYQSWMGNCLIYVYY